MALSLTSWSCLSLHGPVSLFMVLSLSPCSSLSPVLCLSTGLSLFTVLSLSPHLSPSPPEDHPCVLDHPVDAPQCGIGSVLMDSSGQHRGEVAPYWNLMHTWLMDVFIPVIL
ncbi:unnamed protein product [Gadus morhua 'NCC']